MFHISLGNVPICGKVTIEDLREHICKVRVETDDDYDYPNNTEEGPIVGLGMKLKCHATTVM